MYGQQYEQTIYQYLLIYSYRSYQKSFIHYSKVAIYSTVSECCFGYVENSTACQGMVIVKLRG